MSTVEVRDCSFLEFGTFKELPALLAEYAAESAIEGMPPSPGYREENYLPLERAGAIRLIVATIGGALVGFVAVIFTHNPRYDALVAAFEAFFVASEHRSSGAGRRLQIAAENAAREAGAVGIFAGAPVGSRFAYVLDNDRNYRETNRVFFKGLT